MARPLFPPRGRTALAAGIMLALVTASACLVCPAAAAPGADPTGSTRAPSTGAPEDATIIQLPSAAVPITDDPRVASELAWLAADGEPYAKAIAAHQETESQLHAAEGREADAVSRLESAVASLAELGEARPRVVGVLRAATRREAKAATRLESFRSRVQTVAVDLYVIGGPTSSPASALDTVHANENGSRRTYVDSVERYQLGQIQRYSELQQEQADLIVSTEAQLVEIDRRITGTTADRDRASADREQAISDQARLTDELSDRRQRVADARLEGSIRGIDFPFVVLNAYVKAADTMAKDKPGCAIRWSALAAIGRTESGHGTHGDSSVDGAGNIAPPIYGPDLDGSGGFANLADSDNGELDGTSEGDRATGPMQFIPGTWQRWARDGSGDDRADPQNMYDAVLTAAVYLCLKGPGLNTDDGLRRAFRSYNNSDDYVAVVLERTHHYDRFSLPQDPRATTPQTAPVATAAPTSASTSTIAR